MSKKIKMKSTALLLVIAFSLFSMVSLIPSVKAETSRDPLTGDMTTNIPDTNIGGATGGDESNIIPGTSVTTGKETTKAESTSGVQTPPKATTAAKTTAPVSTADTSDGGGNGWIIAVIIVAVIAAIIIAVVALMPRKKDD